MFAFVSFHHNVAMHAKSGTKRMLFVAANIFVTVSITVRYWADDCRQVDGLLVSSFRLLRVACRRHELSIRTILSAWQQQHAVYSARRECTMTTL